MTTTLPASAIAEQASAFAAQVRTSLAYLAPDELDELLDGLGAELEERLAEGRELGDPAQYAEELRQAAGLPPRPSAAKPEPEPRRSVGEILADRATGLADWLAETPGRSGLRDFVVSLRPVWWILRGAVLATFVLFLFGRPIFGGFATSLSTLLLYAAFAAVSVQWGRGKWLPRNWLKVARTVASVLAIVLLLPFAAWFLGAMPAGFSGTTAAVEADFSASGLLADGRPVQNIFAYDCEGRLLPSVRLYDQEGNAISTSPWADQGPGDYWNEDEQRSFAYVPNLLAGATSRWTVFPLRLSEYNRDGSPGDSTVNAAPKYETLAPLSLSCASTEGGSASTGSTNGAGPTAGGSSAAGDASEGAAMKP